MAEGTVKFFNDQRGFGFITGDDSKEYFVHSSGIKEGDSLDEGDKVSFELIEGEKGPNAVQVEKLSD